MTNRNKIKGIYAGSFDPPTNGHLWMFEEGAALFDDFIVAVGINPDKKYTFSINERLEMLREITKKHENITLDTFENQFLVNYAKNIGANYVLRGIRSEQDYGFERSMRHINGDLNPDITTIFLMPPREISEVSSSLVKGLIGPEGWRNIVRKYVPEVVYNKLLEKNKH